MNKILPVISNECFSKCVLGRYINFRNRSLFLASFKVTIIKSGKVSSLTKHCLLTVFFVHQNVATSKVLSVYIFFCFQHIFIHWICKRFLQNIFNCEKVYEISKLRGSFFASKITWIFNTSLTLKFSLEYNTNSLHFRQTPTKRKNFMQRFIIQKGQFPRFKFNTVDYKIKCDDLVMSFLVRHHKINTINKVYKNGREPASFEFDYTTISKGACSGYKKI